MYLLKSKPTKIEIVTHFSEEDEECMGDYYDIEVFFDDVSVFKAGDWYHDKGSDRVSAWLEGIAFVLGKLPKPKKVNIADRKY